MHQPTILIVEDEVAIADTIIYALGTDGMQTVHCMLGQAALDHLRDSRVDLVVLDVGLPDLSGFEVCRRLRTFSDVPVIFLTARHDEIDRIVGLEIGADDYIPKPFHLREVLARLRTVLRRRPRAEPAAPKAGGELIRFDGWQLDLGRRQLRAPGGAEIMLTTGEFDILAVLAGHPGRVFSRDMLMERTRGRTHEAFDRSIDAQIARLRKKVEPDPKAPALIKSVRGVGYVFTGKPAD